VLLKMKKAWVFATAGVVLLAVLVCAYWLTRSSAGYRLNDKMRVQLDVVSDLLRAFDQKHGRLPTESEGLEALVRDRLVNPDGILDPWGSPLQYRCLDAKCSRTYIQSHGPNQADEQGKGDDVRIEVPQLKRK
jgi:hypothetical protein